MPKRRVVMSSVVLFLVAAGAAACGSTPHVSKAAFCSDNSRLDEVTSQVTSAAGFVSALKANRAAIDDFAKNIPDGNIRAEAQKLVDAARAVMASNNANRFSGPALAAAAAKVDTFCRVESTGTPLPVDFGSGKGSAFCADEAVISAVLSAPNAHATLAFLKTNQSKITDYSSRAPTSLEGDVGAIVKAANGAIAANDASKFETQGVALAFNNVDLYCGVNH